MWSSSLVILLVLNVTINKIKCGIGYDAIGEDYQAVAIDVRAQEDGVPITLKNYLRYMMTPSHERDVVLNIISLEFSKTP